MAANSLYTQYKTANVAIKLIVINVAIFLFFTLTNWSLQSSGIGLQSWFVLPSDFSKLIVQPWGIITYAFLHGGFWHILWNMVFLYVFSQYVLNLFSEKRLLTLYFLGAISGGVLFVLAYNLFPVFSRNLGFLLGASAAVNAIIVFIATYTPNSPIRILIFNLKLWHIAAFVVLRDLLTLDISDNAGGLIAHRSKMRTVHKKQTTTSTSKGRLNKTEQQQKIDAILDKISKSGYDSLSKAEKDFLFKAGKE